MSFTTLQSFVDPLLAYLRNQPLFHLQPLKCAFKYFFRLSIVSNLREESVHALQTTCFPPDTHYLLYTCWACLLLAQVIRLDRLEESHFEFTFSHYRAAEAYERMIERFRWMKVKCTSGKPDRSLVRKERKQTIRWLINRSGPVGRFIRLMFQRSLDEGQRFIEGMLTLVIEREAAITTKELRCVFWGAHDDGKQRTEKWIQFLYFLSIHFTESIKPFSDFFIFFRGNL